MSLRFITICFLALFLSSIVFAQDQKLPELGHVSDFELSDQIGEPLSLYSLAKEPRVVSFFFTSCPHVCPTIQGHLSTLHKTYGDKITLLSISIDSKTDTTEKLLSYEKKLGAKFKSWRFLRGDETYIENIMKDAFKLGSGDLPNEHSTRVVLLDKDSNIRGYYRGLESESIAKLQADIKFLLD